MKTFLALLTLLSSLSAVEIKIPDILKPNIENKIVKSTFKRKGPTVQIAILLDTSSSMSGLIDQAKAQIWNIVNEVSKANKNTKSVHIEVGLFEYGKSSLPAYEGYLQMLSPLSQDLDKVSDALFKLHTNGGSEYSGKVILEAVNRLVWSDNKEDLKIIIIAGNEAFDQGNVPYQKAIKKAKANGIIVNTIYCGNMKQGYTLHWADAAKIGGGKYFNINHNSKREYVATPYDEEIISMGQSLNSTYVNYGKRKARREKVANRSRQDKNIVGLSKEAYVQRNIVKAKKQYTQSKDDMVTAYISDKSSVSSIPKSELPKALQNKSVKEVKVYLEKKRIKRISLEKNIKELEQKRDKFLVAHRKKELMKNKNKDLGSAIVKSIHNQAIRNGFIFK